MEQLDHYLNLKKEDGSNYIIEYYIKKYSNIIEDYQKNPEFRYNKEEHKEYKERTLSSKKRSLKRKIRKGEATPMDKMLLEILRGK